MNDVVEQIAKEIHKEVAGEDNVIFILTHVFGSKFLINKNPQSFHTLINSNSGAGKDFILTRFINIFNPEECESYTRISARALDYLHTGKKDQEAGFSWDNKFLCLHDIEEGILNSSTLKLFLTEGTKTAIVQDGIVRVREVQGKPVVIMTSAYGDPEKEQLRRLNIVNLDESDNQTKKVMLMSDSENKIKYKKLRKIFDSLEKYAVRIPYKNELAELLSHQDIFMRSFFPKILDFIRVSAVLNQKDREFDTLSGCLLADDDDYLNCKHIMSAMSYGLSFKPISMFKKQFVEAIKEHFGYMKCFSIRDIEALMGCSYENARKHVKRLQQDGFINGQVQKDEITGKPFIEYSLNSVENIKLPDLIQLIQLKQRTTRTNKEKIK